MYTKRANFQQIGAPAEGVEKSGADSSKLIRTWTIQSSDGQLKFISGPIFRTLKSSGPEHRKRK